MKKTMSCSIDGKNECQKLIEVSIIVEDNNNFLIWRFRTGFYGSYTSTILWYNGLYVDLYIWPSAKLTRLKRGSRAKKCRELVTK